MEEISQQLARQLQQEEEQKATVLVKLEELTVVSKSETLSSALVSIPDAQIRESSTVGSSEQQRRKYNRSSKHKPDDLPATAAVPKETNAEKVFAESGKTRASELEFNPSSVQSRAGAKHVVQPPEEHSSSLSVKVSGGRVSSQLKSQHNRRSLPRRIGAKFRSSDNFIWLPKNKAEVTDEVSDKTETAESDDLVHSNLKSKGEEVEKYDPKLVPRELARQTSLDDTVERVEPLQNIRTCQPGNLGSQNKVDKPKSSSGPGSGRSSFAKKRRAKKLGVCHRCGLTTCNGEYGVCQGYYAEGECNSDSTISGIKSYVLYGLGNSEHVETQTEVETHTEEEGTVPHDVQREG